MTPDERHRLRIALSVILRGGRDSLSPSDMEKLLGPDAPLGSVPSAAVDIVYNAIDDLERRVRRLEGRP